MRSLFIALVALLVAPVLCHANGRYPEDKAFDAAVHNNVARIQVAQATTNKTTGKAVAVTTPAPTLPTDPINSALTAIQNVNNTVIQNAVAALQEADADAGTIVVPAVAASLGTPATATSPAVPAVAGSPAVVKDPISHACYPAQIQYLQSLPTAQPIKSPAPYNLIVLFQYKRDFVNMLLSGSLVPTYLKLGCSALLGQETLILAGTLGLVGVSPALLAPLGAFGTSLGATAATIPLLSTLLPIK